MGKRPLRSTGGGVVRYFSSSPSSSFPTPQVLPPPTTTTIRPPSTQLSSSHPSTTSCSSSSGRFFHFSRKDYVVGLLFVLSFLYALVNFSPNLFAGISSSSCDNHHHHHGGGFDEEKVASLSSSSNNDDDHKTKLINQLLPMAIPGGEFFTVSAAAGGSDQHQLQSMLERKEFCIGWEINSDIWWTHHVDWFISKENDTHYCFKPMDDEEKEKVEFFKRLYDAQFNKDCSLLRVKQMWSSGWGADLRNVIETLHYAYQQQTPIQMYYEKGWHYAATKSFDNPVCDSADMYCFFLNMTKCQVADPTTVKVENQHFTDIWPPLEGRPWSWYKEYATRQQTWLRHAVYQYTKEASSDMGLTKLLEEEEGKSTTTTTCATMHVRRADVALHVGENREYYTIQEYIQGAKEMLAGEGQQQDFQLPSNIFLLTDDENAILEAKRDFPQYNWFTMKRKRFKGSSGGFENQIPSGDPKIEVVVLLSTFRLIQQCPIFIHARSSLAEYMWGIIQEYVPSDQAKRINLINWMNTHHKHTVH